MPESAEISKIARYLSFCLQKKIIAAEIHALAHILGVASITVAWLMIIIMHN